MKTRPEWFERARKKWSREMAQVHLRAISPASENDRLQVALDGWRLRAQAMALVLIERASRCKVDNGSVVPDIPRRCEHFRPLSTSADKRTGKQRWPHLVPASAIGRAA